MQPICRMRHFKWKENHDEMLLHFLVAATREGKTFANHYMYTSVGWRQISNNMIARFGPKFDKNACANRLKTFQKCYRKLVGTLNKPGFECNAVESLVTAEPA